MANVLRNTAMIANTRIISMANMSTFFLDLWLSKQYIPNIFARFFVVLDAPSFKLKRIIVDDHTTS